MNFEQRIVRTASTLGAAYLQGCSDGLNILLIHLREALSTSQSDEVRAVLEKLVSSGRAAELAFQQMKFVSGGNTNEEKGELEKSGS